MSAFTPLGYAQGLLDDAKKKLEDERKKFMAAQVSFNMANQKVAVYQQLVEEETRKRPTESSSPIGDALTPMGDAVSLLLRTEINKTDLIRNLLKKSFPLGMTPGELWEQVKGTVPHRPYVYSVLKRLKDKAEVSERRGKYYFRIVIEAQGEDNKDAVQ